MRAARSRRGSDNATATGPGGADLAAVGRGSRLGLIGAAFSAVANLALALVVTRGFGRHDAGLFFSATAVFLVLEMLSRLGHRHGVRLLHRAAACARRFASDRRPPAGRAQAGPGCGRDRPRQLLAVFAGWLSRELLGGSSPIDLQVMAACLPFAVIYDICLAATRGFGTVKTGRRCWRSSSAPGCSSSCWPIVATTGKAKSARDRLGAAVRPGAALRGGRAATG